MPVPNVASNAPATSSWANAVSDAVSELEGDLYPTVYGQLEVPWAAITGEPATYPATMGVAVVAQTTYGAASAVGAAAEAAHADHAHGTPALPTAAQVGAPALYTSPATPSSGRIYRGPATPTGMSEGDIWIKG